MTPVCKMSNYKSFLKEAKNIKKQKHFVYINYRVILLSNSLLIITSVILLKQK